MPADDLEKMARKYASSCKAFKKLHECSVREMRVAERAKLQRLPQAEAARVISSKLRDRKERRDASKRTGKKLVKRKFTMFMGELTESSDKVTIQNFNPLDIPDFPELLLRAVAATKKKAAWARCSCF